MNGIRSISLDLDEVKRVIEDHLNEKVLRGDHRVTGVEFRADDQQVNVTLEAAEHEPAAIVTAAVQATEPVKAAAKEPGERKNGLPLAQRLQVRDLVAAGKRNQEIADELGLALSTAAYYAAQYRKAQPAESAETALVAQVLEGTEAQAEPVADGFPGNGRVNGAAARRE